MKNATDTILDIIVSFRKAKALFVAAHYDIFTHIQEGKDTVEKICKSIKTNRRATEILLNALVPMGMLDKKNGSYTNTAISRLTLVKGSLGYMGNNLKYQEILSEPWLDLRNVVKRGKTFQPLEHWLFKHETFFREYILAMNDIASMPARELASKIPLQEARNLLDVGAGPGTFSLACLERNDSLQATLLDLPSTIKIARGVFSNKGFLRRARFMVGDYKRLSFGKECFDVVIMSHITHNEGENFNRQLLAKAWKCLRPGGYVVIHDFMLNGERTAPLFDALFSLHMLVSTQSGQTYSTEEYKSWLHKEKFLEIGEHIICGGSPNASRAIVAIRPRC